MIEIITIPAIASPGGHYSHAIRHGGQIFISGQLPIEVDGGHRPDKDFADQASRALSNLLAILDVAGSGKHRLLKVTAYIVGIENWPVFNKVYADLMGDARPARAVVPVPALHYGYLIEVDAIAAG